VLRYFNAAPKYLAVFTANTFRALADESCPFGPDDRLLLTFDNHNSVNGIREFARSNRRR
jgi:selenocysteine lyase/cysteine desulfurase